jgi:hypothetical protein
MARSSRSLDDLKTGIEQSMADALQQHSGQAIGPAETEIIPAFALSDQATPRSPADRLVYACNTTATEIQSTGEAVVQIAITIAAETQALAELLRKHGTAIGSRIEDFTAMSKRVADRVHAAHDDVLSASGAAPSLAPQPEHPGRK